jgi:hypothetical protein
MRNAQRGDYSPSTTADPPSPTHTDHKLTQRLCHGGVETPSLDDDLRVLQEKRGHAHAAAASATCPAPPGRAKDAASLRAWIRCQGSGSTLRTNIEVTRSNPSARGGASRSRRAGRSPRSPDPSSGSGRCRRRGRSRGPGRFLQGQAPSVMRLKLRA